MCLSDPLEPSHSSCFRTGQRPAWDGGGCQCTAWGPWALLVRLQVARGWPGTCTGSGTQLALRAGVVQAESGWLLKPCEENACWLNKAGSRL